MLANDKRNTVKSRTRTPAKPRNDSVDSCSSAFGSDSCLARTEGVASKWKRAPHRPLSLSLSLSLSLLDCAHRPSEQQPTVWIATIATMVLCIRILTEKECVCSNLSIQFGNFQLILVCRSCSAVRLVPSNRNHF